MQAEFHCAWRLHVWLLELEIIRILVSYKVGGKEESLWGEMDPLPQIRRTLVLGDQTSVCKIKTEPHTVEMCYEDEACFYSICIKRAMEGSPCCLRNGRLEPRRTYLLKSPCNSPVMIHLSLPLHTVQAPRGEFFASDCNIMMLTERRSRSSLGACCFKWMSKVPQTVMVLSSVESMQESKKPCLFLGKK